MESKTFFVEIPHKRVAIPDRSWGLWLCHYPCPMSERFLQRQKQKRITYFPSVIYPSWFSVLLRCATQRHPICTNTWDDKSANCSFKKHARCSTHCTWSRAWPDRWQSCQSRQTCRPPCSAGWSAGTGCWSAWNLKEERQTRKSDTTGTKVSKGLRCLCSSLLYLALKRKVTVPADSRAILIS